VKSHAGEFEFEPVPAATLKERVAARIRTAILDGRLRPGARIVESRLAAQLSVAQTTVREAIQDLETQGFLVKLVNRETRVRTLSASDLADLFVLRVELEGLVMEMAHPRVTEEALAPLYEAAAAMQRAAAEENMALFYQLDIDFHRRLWRTAKSELLERVLTPLTVGPVAFVLAGLHAPLRGDYVRVAEDHARILDSLRKDSPEAARALMVSKLHEWREMQMRKFEEERR
jgi:DNA-binding GntR family transcriptional regulator